MRSPHLKAFLGASVAAALVLLSGCGSDQPASDTSASPTPVDSATSSPSVSPSASPTPSTSKVAPSTNLDAIKVTGDYGKTPKITVPSPWAIDKTQTKVLVPSDGAPVADDATVTVNYFGVNGRTGKTFDESFSKAPVSFPLSGVVPGFKKGLVGQKLGSRVLIAMPGEDAYDSSGGRPPEIQVGDTLVFVVDLSRPLSGPKGTTVKPVAGLPTVTDKDGQPAISVPKTDPPTKLVVQPLIKGTGTKVNAQSTIVFNYRWVKWNDGSLLEESYSSGQPATAPLAQLLTGMQKGLTGQPVGSRVLLVIPPSEGYPDGNEKPKIDKTDTLVMVVDILQA